MKWSWPVGVFAGLMVVLLCTGPVHAQEESAYRFAVSFSKEQSAAALDGRVLLILSTDGSADRGCSRQGHRRRR